MKDKLAIKITKKDKDAWFGTIVMEIPDTSVEEGKLKVKTEWYTRQFTELNSKARMEVLKHKNLTKEEQRELVIKFYHLGVKDLNERLSELKFSKAYRVIGGKQIN